MGQPATPLNNPEHQAENYPQEVHKEKKKKPHLRVVPNYEVDEEMSEEYYRALRKSWSGELFFWFYLISLVALIIYMEISS